MTGSLIQFDSSLKYTKNPSLKKANAMPFVKWAGGKRSVIPEIAKRLPDNMPNYWEPFAGGGAVFFAIENMIGKAYLSDLNEELMLAYKMIQKNPEDIIDSLLLHSQKHKKASYYLKVRGSAGTDAIEIASRFIYLNRTCYNGLYRVNKSGKFNVPKGSYKNPMICDSENLRAVSKVLKKVSIKLGQFDKTVTPKGGDFIYCDPPYDECFASYQPGGFNQDDQTRLKNSVDEWVAAGANVMISNADTQLIRKLYKNYNISTIKASRNISCKSDGRGKIDEVLITTYD